MGRLRANFARLGNPMQDCHLRKEPNVTCFPSRPHFATVEMTMCRAPDSRSSISIPTPAAPSGAPPIFDPSRSAAAHPPRPLPPERSEHNPWHRGPKARWMPYAPLPRSGRSLREYSRPADWYLTTDDSISILTEILRFTQDDEWEAGLPSHQLLATKKAPG